MVLKPAKGDATGQASTVAGQLAAQAKAAGVSAQTSTVAGGLKSDAKATGTSAQTATVKGDISLGTMVALAMEQAIHAIQAESEAIWNEETATEEDKTARIAALNDPANVHNRMMQARAKVKADWDVAYVAAQGVPTL